MRKQILITALTFILSGVVLGQTPRPDSPPRHGPEPSFPRHPGPPGSEGPAPPPPGNWIRPHDENRDGVLDANEFNAAIERTIALLDRDGDGTLDLEHPRPKPIMQHPPADQMAREPAPMHRILPPFFIHKGPTEEITLTRSEYERRAREVFSEMDENGDGVLSLEEAAKHGPPHPAPPAPPHGLPPPPNAHFIGAELRFGDKQVKGQPFSADIVIEETRRLYDGTVVSKQSKGAVYRDAAGRTRREQPLEMVAGFPVVGADSKPQMLVFINDFGARSHIFLDVANKTARRTPLGVGEAPGSGVRSSSAAKEELLGTRNIEGVMAEGTRISFEIPVGHLGNEKPLVAVTERWFSPELQVLVLSRHLDPFAGEHIFKLQNIKRIEPVAELFSVPAGYRYQK